MMRLVKVTTGCGSSDGDVVHVTIVPVVVVEIVSDTEMKMSEFAAHSQLWAGGGKDAARPYPLHQDEEAKATTHPASQYRLVEAASRGVSPHQPRVKHWHGLHS